MMVYKRSRKDFEADLQKQESPFVLYGTPLPPLDEDARDDGSYIPLWKQEVTDDRGRKRLHGAFTGGFSAGYFNTVGSKEGWTPATFVSTRTNRAKNVQAPVQQRREDFMDEEDIREQEESKNLSTNEGYTGFGTADDAAHRITLTDLLKPEKDTMGIKLLNKMGWKQGQGIGPKIKRRVDGDGDTGAIHLFAPDDMPMVSLNKKTDHWGLGFAAQGVSSAYTNQKVTSVRVQPEYISEDEDEGRPGLSFASRSRKAKSKRGAFGVGILNDTGSDDEDPYSMGPRISYNKMLGGDKKSKRLKATSGGSNANPLLKDKPVFIPKKPSTFLNHLRKCHDGRLPIEGFVLAIELDMLSTMSLDDDEYRPPPIPEGWKPSRVSHASTSTDTSMYQSTAEAAKFSGNTSSSRAQLLGEPVLPGKSVFDYLTPAAREKLMKASGKINLPPALSEALPGVSVPLAPEIPQLDPQTALQALSRTLNGGFTPYPDDTAKSNRYKAYLESQANNNIAASSMTQSFPVPKPPTMTQEDSATELYEFARTAQVFRPASGFIASRFTTSASSIQASSNAARDTDLLVKPSERLQDPSEEAARVGMFGPLTRSASNFYPTRLLCKRFGIAMPTHAEKPQSTGSYNAMSAAGSTTQASDRVASMRFQHSKDEGNGSSEGPERGKQLVNEGLDTTADIGTCVETSSSTTQNIGVDPDTNEALEQEKPGAAVFRAIFGSDDEDEDES